MQLIVFFFVFKFILLSASQKHGLPQQIIYKYDNNTLPIYSILTYGSCLASAVFAHKKNEIPIKVCSSMYLLCTYYGIEKELQPKLVLFTLHNPCRVKGNGVSTTYVTLRYQRPSVPKCSRA